MKRIKFRVYDTSLKKFLNSSVNNINFLRAFLDIVDQSDHGAASFSVRERESGTILQLYTGLKDSMGDEIYEGDILQLNDESKNYPTGEVYFGSGAFHVRDIDCLWFGAKNGVCEDYLIRGNIFQNEIINGK